MPTTILLAHHDPSFLLDMVPRLADLGHYVLSPARTASLALLIAAQTPPGFAIIGEKLAGQRNGRVLARVLRDVWGLPSVVLREGVTLLEGGSLQAELRPHLN